MDEWITKAEILEMGMTEGQYKWRVLTGDIRRHPESRRLYNRNDVAALVRGGRRAMKPFGDRAERSEMPKRERTKKTPEEIAKQALLTKLRARMALKICAQLMTHDTKLGRQVSGFFHTTPEQLIETARQFR